MISFFSQAGFVKDSACSRRGGKRKYVDHRFKGCWKLILTKGDKGNVVRKDGRSTAGHDDAILLTTEWPDSQGLRKDILDGCPFSSPPLDDEQTYPQVYVEHTHADGHR